MYKFSRNRQFNLADFNQPIGLKMNPENRWVVKAASIPWFDIEQHYAGLFPSNTGMPAKPLQTALGSLIIQKQYGYSDRELVDQIYRNRTNRAFCKAHDIRISGPALGRPRKLTLEERKQSYTDNVDRIEVERGFSLAKRCFGLGLIRTKLDITTRSSIALSLIAMNLDKLAGGLFLPERFMLLLMYVWQKKRHENSSEHIKVFEMVY